jgi:hypothetical protein
MERILEEESVKSAFSGTKNSKGMSQMRPCYQTSQLISCWESLTVFFLLMNVGLRTWYISDSKEINCTRQVNQCWSQPYLKRQMSYFKHISRCDSVTPSSFASSSHANYVVGWVIRRYVLPKIILRHFSRLHIQIKKSIRFLNCKHFTVWPRNHMNALFFSVHTKWMPVPAAARSKA